MAKKRKQIDEYKILRNKGSALVRDAKKKFVSSLIENSRDTAQVWRAMNTITNEHRKNHSSTPNKYSADTFDDYFLPQVSTIIPKAASSSSSSYSHSLLIKYCEQKRNTNDSCTIPEVTVYEAGNYNNNI